MPAANATTPQPNSAPHAGREVGPVLVRALSVALGCVGLVLAMVGAFAYGLGSLPTETLPYYGLGAGAALFAGMVVLWLQGRLLDPRATIPYAGDGRLMAGRMQSLLAAAFGVKLFVLTVGFLGLRMGGAKFAETTTFAVTFAGGALLSQLATAAFLARALQHRPDRPPVS